MRLFNSTLERFKRQFDSKVFKFAPRDFVEVPDYLADTIYEALKDKGIFKVPAGITEEEFRAEERKAQIAYLGITLRERVVNYLAFQDDQRKKGATPYPDPRYERAIRWEKELRQMLEMEAPIEEELSFLNMRRVENTELGVEKPEELGFNPNASYQGESFKAPAKKTKTVKIEEARI